MAKVNPLLVLNFLASVWDWWTARKQKKAADSVKAAMDMESIHFAPDSGRRRLSHFSASEFDLTSVGGENWWPYMSSDVLRALDSLRELWGLPIRISPVAGALGRRLGLVASSDHNFDRWEEVRAVDVFVEGVETPAQAMEVLKLARACGFNALGVYPHWRNSRGEQQCGFHFGVRPGVAQEATWGMVREHLMGSHRTVAMSEAVKVVGIPIPLNK